MIERIKQKFRKRVMKEGKSLVKKDEPDSTRFLESMITVSKYSRLISKFNKQMQKFVQRDTSSQSPQSQTNSKIFVNDSTDLGERSLNFFVTQGIPSQFMP